MFGLTTGVLKKSLAGLFFLCLMIPVAEGGEDILVTATARENLDLVWDAARSWESDAALIYLENDEELSPGGLSGRWGYLFYSVSADIARSYSVRDGKIVSAEFLPFKFEAPPLSDPWIDSNAAIQSADKKTREFREELGGRATTLLLIRGGFDEKEPDMTTWTIVYSAPGVPSLFVVVDAVTGKVKRKWRG